MRDALIVSVLSVLPRNRMARVMGGVARSGVSRWFTAAFVRAYGVNLDEAEGSLADYPTLEALFTRRLKPGVRPVDPAPEALVSPVDGRCAFAGVSRDGAVQVAPGRSMRLDVLLGESVSGERAVAVLYLSPTDYHRVHVPREGTAVRWRYVPGTLWPVFPAAVRRVQGLFTRNERAAVELQTEAGAVWVVLVGAFGVGRITLSLCDVVSNTGAQAQEAAIDVAVQRAEELGVFHLGSTVVLVAPPDRVRWSVEAGDVVRLGQAIGSVVA
ncbi:MAG: phosphatidylserine decarboxylase [Myxococcales bacterium]|nr:phosphatidylserine decarboxylase [Myxococcales bacterium]